MSASFLVNAVFFIVPLMMITVLFMMIAVPYMDAELMSTALLQDWQGMLTFEQVKASFL